VKPCYLIVNEKRNVTDCNRKVGEVIHIVENLMSLKD